jgi:hypothetical protein
LYDAVYHPQFFEDQETVMDIGIALAPVGAAIIGSITTGIL